MPLLFLFIGVPLIEIFLLIKLGGQIGTLATIGLVVITGVVGASLAKWQGAQTLARIQREVATGNIPTGAMLDGVLILIAGVVLITPGVLTDAFGILLLIPPVRAALHSRVVSWFKRRAQVRTPGATRGQAVFVGDMFVGGTSHAASSTDIIETDVVELSPQDFSENH